jgi:hypothetical protein
VLYEGPLKKKSTPLSQHHTASHSITQHHSSTTQYEPKSASLSQHHIAQRQPNHRHPESPLMEYPLLRTSLQSRAVRPAHSITPYWSSITQHPKALAITSHSITQHHTASHSITQHQWHHLCYLLGTTSLPRRMPRGVYVCACVCCQIFLHSLVTTLL